MHVEPMSLVVYDMRLFPAFTRQAEIKKKARGAKNVGSTLMGIASQIVRSELGIEQ